MALTREQMKKDLIGMMLIAFDCMSDDELEKLHKETFEKVADGVERSILFGEEPDKNEH